MKELFSLYISFFKIGLFTFGGGYSMLPMLERELVRDRGWTTENELLDVFSIAQCTPGVIAVNTATFIGYKRRGIVGGIFATLGVISPSVVIISIIAAFISNFAEIAAVQHALAGIRAAVCVLVGNSVWKLIKKSVVDKITGAVFAVALILAVTGIIPTAVTVIAAAMLGFFSVLVKARKGEERNGEKK